MGKRDLFRVDYNKTFRAALCADISFCVFTDGISWEFYMVEQSMESKAPQLLKKIEILYDPLKRVEIKGEQPSVRQQVFGSGGN